MKLFSYAISEEQLHQIAIMAWHPVSQAVLLFPKFFKKVEIEYRGFHFGQEKQVGPDPAAFERRKILQQLIINHSIYFRSHL